MQCCPPISKWVAKNWPYFCLTMLVRPLKINCAFWVKIFPNKYERVRQKSNIFEPTCAYAQWALMHHFASVRLLLDQKSPDNTFCNSYNYVKKGAKSGKPAATPGRPGMALAGVLTSTSSCFIIFFFLQQGTKTLVEICRPYNILHVALY